MELKDGWKGENTNISTILFSTNSIPEGYPRADINSKKKEWIALYDRNRNYEYLRDVGSQTSFYKDTTKPSNLL